MDEPLTLRQALRLGTRDHHDRLDAAFSAFDPRHPAALGAFLGAQLAALATLHPRHGADAEEAGALLAEMVAALRADLAALACPPPRMPAALTVAALPLLYVLRGSRMGAQVITRRWRGGGADTAGAGRYLTLDPQTDRWRSLCLRLQARSGDDPAAARAVAASASVFDHFAAALALNQPDHSPRSEPEPAHV